MPQELLNHPILLDSLRVARGFFDLGGKLSPGSIRDQIVRTRLFIDQLQQGEFLGNSLTACIIGAGPAGVTAALKLSKFSNVQTWLFDSNPKPLSLLANADHRHISPTLYDWPASHSRLLEYAGTLRFDESMLPSDLRDMWLSELEIAGGQLTCVWGAEAALLVGPGPPWPVELKQLQHPNVPREFDLVLFCRGFGKERSVPLKKGGQLRPFGFWERDLYPRFEGRGLPTWHLAQTDRDCAVVVLGGGDGAIQDLLRFITNGLSTRKILNEIAPLLPSSAELSRVAAQMENEVRHNALAQPSEQFRNDREAELIALVRQIRTGPLSYKLKQLIRFDQLRVYFKDPILGPCYPLNHFLALLFQRGIKEITGRDILYPNHTVSAIDCSCIGDDHFNNDHEVFFETPNDSLSVRCRVVVPRLGIDPATVPCDRTTALHHALPYWLPDWKPTQR